VSEEKAAPAPAGGDSRNLITRVVAALVLAPLAIAAAYVGGFWWTALVTLGAVGLYVEWLMVVGAVSNRAVVAAGTIALLGAAELLVLGRAGAAVLLLIFALVVVATRPSPQRRLWTAAGFLYAGAALMASVLVRQDQIEGLVALILVLLVVWATDIGGYFVGRSFGGPKLWPRISPNKTWAGAIGGFVASLLVAAGFVAFGLGRTGPLLLLAACLSIASQLGDLLESAIKRHFGVKDSSHIIPGHGGLMDRLDGYVAAIVMAAIFGILRGGVDGVGRALMVW
jgi:phosphatidate cytidylyltransferase